MFLLSEISQKLLEFLIFLEGLGYNSDAAWPNLFGSISIPTRTSAASRALLTS